MPALREWRWNYPPCSMPARRCPARGRMCSMSARAPREADAVGDAQLANFCVYFGTQRSFTNQYEARMRTQSMQPRKRGDQMAWLFDRSETGNASRSDIRCRQSPSAARSCRRVRASAWIKRRMSTPFGSPDSAHAWHSRRRPAHPESRGSARQCESNRGLSWRNSARTLRLF